MEKPSVQKSQEWYDQNRDQYEGLVTTLEKLMETLLKENRIPYHSVNGRVKTRDSFLQKFDRKPYSGPDEIMDIAGLRIITHTTAEVVRVCDLIEREFSVDQENSGNKAADMDVDKVGYLSVHYIVTLASPRADLCEYRRFRGLRCEIQARSLLQHAWAEIEHDRGYKFAGVLPKEIRRKFYLVAGTLELMDQEFCALSREIDHYAAEVKAKAVQGDLQDITIDSTSLLEFLNEYFSKCGTDVPETFYKKSSGVIIDELSSFGIKTLHQLKDLLSQKRPQEWLVGRTKGATYIGVLRDAMILKSPKNYFELAWDNRWSARPSDIKEWLEIGVDLDEVGKYIRLPSLPQEEAWT